MLDNSRTAKTTYTKVRAGRERITPNLPIATYKINTRNLSACKAGLKTRKNAPWEIDLHVPGPTNWGFITEHEQTIINMRDGDLELKGHTTITAAKGPCEILSHTPENVALHTPPSDAAI